MLHTLKIVVNYIKYLPAYCVVNLDKPNISITINKGEVKNEITRGPINVLGTTPGNSL